MTEEKVETKRFIFDISESKEPTVELIQLISLAMQSYDKQTHAQPCDIPSVLRYFTSLYGVKL